MRTMRTKFLVRYINMIYCLAEIPVCEIPTHRLGQRPLLRHADCLGGNLGKLLTHTSSSSYRAQKLSILEAGVGGSPAKRKSSLFSFVKKIVPALRHTKRQHGPRQGFVWGHVCNFARILLVLDFCSHPPPCRVPTEELHGTKHIHLENFNDDIANDLAHTYFLCRNDKSLLLSKSL